MEKACETCQAASVGRRLAICNEPASPHYLDWWPKGQGCEHHRPGPPHEALQRLGIGLVDPPAEEAA